MTNITDEIVLTELTVTIAKTIYDKLNQNITVGLI